VVQPRVLNVAHRLESAGELLQRTLGSTYKIAVDAPDRTINVEVDPGQFEAAIVNAVVNARDAMPDGGTMTLAARAEKRGGSRCVRISISDTGMGMPKDVRDRAFDPFFTTKEVGKGTGLGLSQIHGFAAQAGGHAEIESEEGRGTTISIIIPVTDKPDERPEDATAASEAPLLLKILLVEDNDGVRDFAHEMLRDAGCDVIVASNASEALAKLESEPVDLLLSDIVMPMQSGIELANQVREARPELPIVLMTGYSDELANGVDYPVIAKPFTPTQLRSVIETTLAQHSVAVD
jgi:CheY-like chemotaxis protein/anti-sigma regulatory factor (Ser/Thr protein kinase)